MLIIIKNVSYRTIVLCFFFFINQREVSIVSICSVEFRYENVFLPFEILDAKVLSMGVSFTRPFPSSLVPRIQNESKCETFHIKISSACSFIFLQIKVIFIRMVSHLDSL